LHLVQHAVLRQSLDRGDLLADHRGQRYRARPHRHAVDMHGAGTALRDPAAVLGAGQDDRVAQHPQQRGAVVDLRLIGLSVDVESSHAHSPLVAPARALIVAARPVGRSARRPKGLAWFNSNMEIATPRGGIERGWATAGCSRNPAPVQWLGRGQMVMKCFEPKKIIWPRNNPRSSGNSFEHTDVLPYLFSTWPTGGQATVAFRRETIEINGCKLSFARGGAGDPLIYLHGTDGLAEWPTILDTLAERFDVIVPDHPGFGASEVPAWIDDVSDAAYIYLDAIA